MEIITIAAVILVVSFFPVKTGWVAKDLGRSFWVWFFLGLFLPFASMIILLCLPIKKLQMEQKNLPLSNHNGQAPNYYKRIKIRSASESKRAS
jgi:uncharacterized membrane protein